MPGPYVYNNNIPQTNDLPSASQPLLLQNFQSIQNLIDINHYDFNNANAGKHTFVSLPEQGGPPATAVDEVALFCLPGTRSTVAELCFRRENTPAVYIPFTEQLAAMPGWFVTPGGILIKWMNVTIPLAGIGHFFFSNPPFTWPTATTIPAFTTVPFAVFLSSQLPAANQYGHVDFYQTASATTTQVTIDTASILSLGGWNAHTCTVFALGT